MIKLKKLIDDYNGTGKSINVPFSKKLTGGYSLDISNYSGLVSVKKRRTSKEIADEWSNKIFGKSFSKSTYTAKIPAVVARQTYVLETLLKVIKLKKKSVCDLGAGEGDFLKMLKEKKITKDIFGVEPSKINCKKLTSDKIKNFQGTLEDFVASDKFRKFDILTMMWTLCNTSNCYDILNQANKMCNKNGYIIIAESSRILVPYKKPIQMYIRKGNPDIHSFHFSKNSLCNLLILSKFKPVYINRYIDSDWLVVIAQKTEKVHTSKIKLDKAKNVKRFFHSWYKESLKYAKELI